MEIESAKAKRLAGVGPATILSRRHRPAGHTKADFAGTIACTKALAISRSVSPIRISTRRVRSIMVEAVHLTWHLNVSGVSRSESRGLDWQSGHFDHDGLSAKRGKRFEVAQPMRWERGYYYHVRKVNGHVVREYVGTGRVVSSVKVRRQVSQRNAGNHCGYNASFNCDKRSQREKGCQWKKPIGNANASSLVC